MRPQHTFTSPHLPTLTFPYISPYLPHTPSHFPTPPFISLPTSLLPPPTPQHIFLLSPHLPHLPKVWRSYHVTKFLWRSYCGKVNTWRSYWQPFTTPHTSFLTTPTPRASDRNFSWGYEDGHRAPRSFSGPQR